MKSQNGDVSPKKIKFLTGSYISLTMDCQKDDLKHFRKIMTFTFYRSRNAKFWYDFSLQDWLGKPQKVPPLMARPLRGGGGSGKAGPLRKKELKKFDGY